jgi:hypothetical protein
MIECMNSMGELDVCSLGYIPPLLSANSRLVRRWFGCTPHAALPVYLTLVTTWGHWGRDAIGCNVQPETLAADTANSSLHMESPERLALSLVYQYLVAVFRAPNCGADRPHCQGSVQTTALRTSPTSSCLLTSWLRYTVANAKQCLAVDGGGRSGGVCGFGIAYISSG